MRVGVCLKTVGFFLALWLSQSAVAQLLIDRGRPVARIYVSTVQISGQGIAAPARKNDPLALAAEELNYHLKAMAGTALEVVQTDDARAIVGPGIVLGGLSAKLGAGPVPPTDSKEAFRLQTRGDLLLISGESDEAVLMGAYSLLEALGCDWVMPGVIGEIIPNRSTVNIPRMDRSEAPDFQMRRLWYGGGKRIISVEERGRFEMWLRRQKAGSYEPVAAQVGGHYWQTLIRKHQADFDRDPTMYALSRKSDGKLQRAGPQIETTNPRVIDLMVADIEERIVRRKLLKTDRLGLPIGPADGFGFSESPEFLAAGSRQVDAFAGVNDVTDQLVLFGNTLLERLGQDYPNLYLGFYSYGAHASYPKRYTPHPRLAAIFAPITFSRFHSVVDPSSRSQPYFRSIVEQWAALSRKQGNPLLFRGYNWNLADNMLPYTRARIWGEEIPFYKRMGITGLNVEATKAWSINGPGDWIFMKLAWNSRQDWRQLLHEYCEKSFGNGAAPMEAYFLRLAARQHSGGQEAGSYHAIPLLYGRAFVADAQRDIKSALTLAQTKPQKARVGYFALNVRALELYLDYHEATLRFDFAAARRAYDAMLTHWHDSHALNSDLVAKEATQHLSRFIAPFLTEALASTSGPNKMVLPLPDALPTAFASEREGSERGYQAQRTDEKAFRPTKTFSSTWDAQRLGAQGHDVWYRYRFRLPPAARSQVIHLFLGSFDNGASVWINGQLAGRTKRQFSKPAIFDLTPGIRLEAENVLAVQIHRENGINELGVGGLFRPSFIFGRQGTGAN